MPVIRSSAAPGAPPLQAPSLPPVTLVLGGARSGKSGYAESLLDGHAEKIYLATSQAWDDEMRERIRQHQARRLDGWSTVEEPLDLPGALQAHGACGHPILVDCLTLWLTNVMLADEADDGRRIDAEADRLLAALPGLAAPVIFVANEVGLGIVPDNALARRFRDHAGRLNQRIAAHSRRVILIAAGLPLILKDER